MLFEIIARDEVLVLSGGSLDGIIKREEIRYVIIKKSLQRPKKLVHPMVAADPCF